MRSTDALVASIIKGLIELCKSSDSRAVAASFDSDAQPQSKFCSGTEAFVSSAVEDEICLSGHVQSGLEGLIGVPSPRVREAVEEEHTERDDSHLRFETPNYKVCAWQG